MNQAALDVLRSRRSIRKYKKEQISEEALCAILEAGTWAPTAMNRQSPVMVVVQDAATIEQMRRLNAQVMGRPDADPFYGAPTVVVVLADGQNPCWEKDGSLVMGNLMLAAEAVGVGSCWINRAKETFDAPEGKALLKAWGLPETRRGVGNCILGYADETPAPKPRKADYIVRV